MPKTDQIKLFSCKIMPKIYIYSLLKGPQKCLEGRSLVMSAIKRARHYFTYIFLAALGFLFLKVNLTNVACIVKNTGSVTGAIQIILDTLRGSGGSPMCHSYFFYFFKTLFLRHFEVKSFV